MSPRAAARLAWALALVPALGVRVATALGGPLMWGYDAWGHVAYVLFVATWGAVPWADQGWSYFHPPLHYALGSLLAHFGSGEVLMRGLMLLASAASLGTAALAAWLVRRSAPRSSWLAPLAFAAVALLPVHLFMSAMPGNELTETLLAAAAIAVFVRNEERPRPRLVPAVGVGALIGAALLTKFSGLLPLLVVLCVLALRAVTRPPQLARCAGRALLVSAVALAVASPYYTRNLRAFGTPFQLSRDFALVRSVERDQPPGERRLADYLRLPPRLFWDPNPLASHLLGSVWGTVYLNVWADTYRESDVARALEAERSRARTTTLLALLGLAPSALALLGALLAARDAWRGQRRALYATLLVLSAGTLAAFALFSWRVPIWSALKSSYLLGLSLPYGVFLARSAEWLSARGPAGARALAPAAVVVVSVPAVALALPGAVLPRRADAPATGAVRFHFGEYDEARRIYGRLIAGSGYKAGWLDNLAAVELADGNAERARRLYARAVALADERGLRDPYRDARRAVATAAAGELAEAERQLDALLAEQHLPEALANRGAVRAARGDGAGAEADLREALEIEPDLLPAHLNLARVLARGGRADEARAARARAARAACRGPRRYPYGVGTGEVLQWGVGMRWLLLLEDDGLWPAKPSFYANACRELARSEPG